MKYPRMIMFDYGQTLTRTIDRFNGLRGTEALLQYAVENKHGLTAQEIQAEADAINSELGRYSSTPWDMRQVEVPNRMFSSYLYQAMGIKLALTPVEIDRIFWDAADPDAPTDGIADFLAFLKAENIRTGVISNISICREVLEERINRLLPDNEFEFIIATSEYLFRKPNRRIFELALEKADLKPEDVWYIGDNYQYDVMGAGGAGIFPVWYLGASGERGKTDDVLSVFHWKELEKILEGLREAH